MGAPSPHGRSDIGAELPFSSVPSALQLDEGRQALDGAAEHVKREVRWLAEHRVETAHVLDVVRSGLLAEDEIGDDGRGLSR